MILLIAAMPEECEAMLKHCSRYETVALESLTCYQFELEGQAVILARSGIGKVNAAYCTSVLSLHYPIDLIINIGSAGGLKADQKVTDMIIAAQLTYHDLDIGKDLSSDSRFNFYAEADLLAQVEAVMTSLSIKAHKGLLVSGDQFVTPEHARRIIERYPAAIAVDMESGAIAAVAVKRAIPFIIVRCLSDITIHPDNELTFAEYLSIASQQSALVARTFIRSRKSA